MCVGVGGGGRRRGPLPKGNRGGDLGESVPIAKLED